MAKVYTTVPGLVLRVGEFGDATNTEPAIVPDEVALQFEREIAGQYDVEEDVADPASPGKTKKEKRTVRYAQARTDIRVERDRPAPKAPPKGQEK